MKEGFPIEIGLTRTPREGDATFLTTEEPAQEEEEPPPEESSEDEDSDDPDIIKLLKSNSGCSIVSINVSLM